MADVWGAAIADAEAARGGGKAGDDDIFVGGGGGDPSEDGFLMTSGLKNASKCRSCATTLDVGTPAWFNRDGEPGRKVTCQECHKKKFGDAPPVDPAGDAVDAKDGGAKPKTTKKRKLAPKFTPEMLLDKDKGLTAVFRSFQKIPFQGKGHETSDLRRLLNKYREWAHTLVPETDFGDFVAKLEKGSTSRVRVKLSQIRDVVAGLIDMETLEQMEEYELSARADARADLHAAQDMLTFGDDDDDDWMAQPLADGEGDDLGDAALFGGGAAAPKAAKPAAAALSDEQRARIERNKQAALEKAAARKRAATTDEDAEMEMEWRRRRRRRRAAAAAAARGRRPAPPPTSLTGSMRRRSSRPR